MASAALKNIYTEFPQLYNFSLVFPFLPEVIYKMRQTDQKVITAITHRLWSLSHTGDSVFWKQSVFVALDILLDWGMHNVLWYLCGISAFLIQKDFFLPDYLKKWSAKGIQVASWTVSTFDEKNYCESHFGSSYITASMLESVHLASRLPGVAKLPGGFLKGHQNTVSTSPGEPVAHTSNRHSITPTNRNQAR